MQTKTLFAWYDLHGMNRYEIIHTKYYLRNDAVPDVILVLAKFEYCNLALALWAAAVSTAETLRKPANLLKVFFEFLWKYIKYE